MKILFTPEAWKDYLHWQKHDHKILERINELIKDTVRSPFAGIGKPEALRHQLSGNWSRRINQQHRLVYRVMQDNTLAIISVRYHYD